MRTLHHRALLALVGTILLTGLAACAPTPEATDRTDGFDSTSDEQAFEDWRLALDDCMAEAGFDLPSVAVQGEGEEGGGDAVSVDPGEVDLEALESAQEMCFEKVGQPPAQEGMPNDDEMHEMQLVFAKCMREAGYDYHDPTPGKGGAVSAMPADEFDPADVDRCTEEAGLPWAQG